MTPAWVEGWIESGRVESRVTSFAHWLTPRRLRSQGILLALCLWLVCAFDFATPGLFDRAGNIKFQDFLQFYISARLIAQGRVAELYDQPVADQEMRALTDEQTRVRLPPVYGPQVGLFFVPLTRFSFPVAVHIWVTLSLIAIAACLYLLWRSCPSLRLHAPTVVLGALAFPPLFHFFVRGQITAPLLVCFSAAFLAFRSGRDWLAGIALGCLVFKPQFLVAVPLILLLAHAWKAFAALALSAVGQLAFTWLYFGPTVIRSYFDTMLHTSRWINLAETGPAQIQMHSLRSFWTLLIPWSSNPSPSTPWPNLALALYLLSSIVVIVMAALIWKSSAALALRFSALTIAAVLVNPHLFVYDLLVLAPALLLLADWILTHPDHPSSAALSLLAYLTFILPLFGPLSRWTHLQLSVIAMTALLCLLWRQSRTPIYSPLSS